MSLWSTITDFFGGLWSKIPDLFNKFIQQAIPMVKQAIILQYKDEAIKIVMELAATDLSSEAKRLEAIKKLTAFIAASGKEIAGSLVNLIIELAVQEYKTKIGE